MHGAAAVLDHVSSGPTDAYFSDQRKHEILGGHTGLQGSFDQHAHRLRFALQQTLHGQNVGHLACSDAERQSAESTVGAGVTVATNDGHTWLCQP